MPADTDEPEPEEDVPEDVDETQQVRRTDEGVSYTVELKRGTGTRDQDKVVGKLKAESIEEAREDLEEFKNDLRVLAAFSRRINPERPLETEETEESENND